MFLSLLAFAFERQNMTFAVNDHCSFVFKMSLGQHRSVFRLLKPYTTSFKLFGKKSHNLHNLSHN